MTLPSKEAINTEQEVDLMAEKPVTPEISPEIEHVEAVSGAEIYLPQPVTDDSGATVMDNAAPQQVTVTLPLTDDQMNQALHLKIIYSLRWLAEWARRLAKIVGGKFIYQFKG